MSDPLELEITGSYELPNMKLNLSFRGASYSYCGVILQLFSLSFRKYTSRISSLSYICYFCGAGY